MYWLQRTIYCLRGCRWLDTFVWLEGNYILKNFDNHHDFQRCLWLGLAWGLVLQICLNLASLLSHVKRRTCKYAPRIPPYNLLSIDLVQDAPLDQSHRPDSAQSPTFSRDFWWSASCLTFPLLCKLPFCICYVILRLLRGKLVWRSKKKFRSCTKPWHSEESNSMYWPELYCVVQSESDLGFLVSPGNGAVSAVAWHKQNETHHPTHLFSGAADGSISVWQAGGDWVCLKTLHSHKYVSTHFFIFFFFFASLHHDKFQSLTMCSHFFGKMRGFSDWFLLFPCS